MNLKRLAASAAIAGSLAAGGLMTLGTANASEFPGFEEYTCKTLYTNSADGSSSTSSPSARLMRGAI